MSALIVDDTDTAKLFYHGIWYATWTTAPGVYNGTYHSTKSPGRVQISFFGSHVQVVGTVLARAPGNPTYPIISTYIIDNEMVGTFTAAPGDIRENGVAFFTSGDLELGSHTLVINVTSASTDYPFGLDYVMYVPATVLSSTLSPSPTPSASAAPSPDSPDTTLASSFSDPATVTSAQSSDSLNSIINVPVLSSTPNSTTTTSMLSSTDFTTKVTLTSASTTTGSVSPAPNANTSTATISSVADDSSLNHMGGIIGGVIGAIALLAALFTLRLWKRRREGGRGEVIENRNNSVGPVPQHPVISRVTPFLLPRDYSGPSANFVSPETAAPLGVRSALGAQGAISAPRNSKMALVAVTNNHSGSGDAWAPAGGGRGTPSEVSSANASGSTAHLLLSPEEGGQRVASSTPHYGAVPDGTSTPQPQTESLPAYTTS